VHKTVPSPMRFSRNHSGCLFRHVLQSTRGSGVKEQDERLLFQCRTEHSGEEGRLPCASALPTRDSHWDSTTFKVTACLCAHPGGICWKHDAFLPLLVSQKHLWSSTQFAVTTSKG
jgi:hypothetical protein